jgi:carbonic anhydrase/acetyltransferase-like protein (isoleucine patch superfamily)
MNNNVKAQTWGQPLLGERVFVDPTAAIIGDIHLGDDCSIWPMSVIRGDVNRIRVGKRCSIQDGSVLHVTHAGPHTGVGWPLTIGDDVTVGHRAVLHGCQLGSQILVGIASIVMDGAIVEDQVVIGANSLVTPGKILHSGHLYVGSPARQVRKLTQHEVDYFRYTASNYVRLKDQYLEQLNEPTARP